MLKVWGENIYLIYTLVYFIWKLFYVFIFPNWLNFDVYHPNLYSTLQHGNQAQVLKL